MVNKLYILSFVVGVVAFALLWFPVLWLMNRFVWSETVYQNYVKRNIMKELHDRCSDGELIWILYHLKPTENMKNLNRSEIRGKILEIQSQKLSQWEFVSDGERIISPTISKICTQSYDTIISELDANCTINELHNICNYINVEKCVESNFNSKWDWTEEIINVKRTRDLNVTKLIHKFCIERNLEILTMELIASCTGGRIKEIFGVLIQKQSGCDVMCDYCVDKMEFVEVVVEIKRRCDYNVNIDALLDEYCVQPELKSLKRKLMENCSGIQSKQILDEMDDKSTCDYCVEKADFVNEIIDAKQRRFSAINVNTFILKYCFKSVES